VATLRLAYRGDWRAAPENPLAAMEAPELGCAAISAEWHGIHAVGLARATDAGPGVAAWTVRAPDVYCRLVGLGVGAVCVEADALDG
jgi:glycerophosphoryl diester phosphodiesterase